MANKEKRIFKVIINNGKEIYCQRIKRNGESWYETTESGIIYYSKQQIKDCPILNNK